MGIPVSAVGSNSSLECRDNTQQLDNLEAQVNAFNTLNDARWETQVRMLRALQLHESVLAQFFGEDGFRLTREDGLNALQWHNGYLRLEFRNSDITKESQVCAWVSFDHRVQLVHLILDQNGEPLRLEVFEAH